MIFRQYLHAAPIAASYLFGCGGQAQGVVVDLLAEEVDFYIEEAKKTAMNITYVFDTHLYATTFPGADDWLKKRVQNICCIRQQKQPMTLLR